MSRETIYRLERGRSPDADTLMRICDALRIPVVDLVPGWRSQEDVDVPSLAEPLPGYRIRQRRRELGISLATAAQAAGVSVATMSRFERLMSAHGGLVSPIYRDDPEGEMAIENDALVRLLQFQDSAELNDYCTAP